MLKIDSAQNETFKKLFSLTTSKGLKKEGLFLLSGENLIREFLRRPNLKIHYELITAKMKPLITSKFPSRLREGLGVGWQTQAPSRTSPPSVLPRPSLFAKPASGREALTATSSH